VAALLSLERHLACTSNVERAPSGTGYDYCWIKIHTERALASTAVDVSAAIITLRIM